MATRIGGQAAPSNEQVHDPAFGRLASNSEGAQDLSTREQRVVEPVASEQASTQQQEDGTTDPRPSELGLNLLFPHLEWARPGASLTDRLDADSTPRSSPVRRQRIPYVQPVDTAPGAPEDDLRVSSAFGFEDMPGILMYAPERPLLSPAAGSMDAIPDHLVLCVEEDAFERAWIAPQWYWRSVF